MRTGREWNFLRGKFTMRFWCSFGECGIIFFRVGVCGCVEGFTIRCGVGWWLCVWGFWSGWCLGCGRVIWFIVMRVRVWRECVLRWFVKLHVTIKFCPWIIIFCFRTIFSFRSVLGFTVPCCSSVLWLQYGLLWLMNFLWISEWFMLKLFIALYIKQFIESINLDYLFWTYLSLFCLNLVCHLVCHFFKVYFHYYWFTLFSR